MYLWNVLVLFAKREISLQTAIRALSDRPIAVVGKRSTYIVDPTFEG